MNKIYLLSACEKNIAKGAKVLAHFHFKGIYRGVRINNIVLESKEELAINEEYLLLAEVLYVREKILNGRIIKIKRII